MTDLKDDFKGFRFGALVRVKRGLTRKPWEWIGRIQMVSGDLASVVWRVAIPGFEGKRPVTYRTLDQLELMEGMPHSLLE